MQHLFWALPWLQKINLVKSDAPELSWALLDICDCQIQSLLLGLLLPNQIHHMVNGINCCVWLTYDTQKTSQLAWSGMIVCCQSYREYFKHILCLIPFSALSSVTAQQPSTETEHQEKIKPFNKSLEQFTEFNLKLIKHNGNGIWYTSLYAHCWQWLAKINSIHQFLKLDDLITLNKRGMSNNWRNLSTTITNSIVVLVGCFLAMFACIKIELEIRSKINQWCLTHWHSGGI